MRTGALGREKMAVVEDEYELPAVHRDRNDLAPIECLNLTGINPAR
jgi:hypothetical protein